MTGCARVTRPTCRRIRPARSPGRLWVSFGNDRRSPARRVLWFAGLRGAVAAGGGGRDGAVRGGQPPRSAGGARSSVVRAGGQAGGAGAGRPDLSARKG